jgi:hypothetical protein
MTRTSIPYLVPDREFARIARWQRKYLAELAGKVERGEPLDETGREWTAGVLRAWADQIPIKQPKKRGQQPKIDAGPVAIQYAVMVCRDGKKKTHAIAELAERHDVSEQTIKNAVRKYGAAAMRMIRGPESGKIFAE